MDEIWIARAFADEVRAEMARQHVTARAMQAAVGEGLSSSAYQKYFVQQTRPVPGDIQLAVARVLDVRTSELWRRAEEAAPALAERAARTRVDPELEVGTSKRQQRNVARAREAFDREHGGREPQGRSRADDDDGTVGRSAAS